MKNKPFGGLALLEFVKSTKGDRASLYKADFSGLAVLVHNGRLLSHCFNLKASRVVSAASVRINGTYLVSDISRTVGNIYKL